MKVNYTPEAVSDLDAIHAYIAEDNPHAADQVIARILQAMAILEAYPLVGREGRVVGTREWPISGLPYVGIYTLPDEINVDIIAVLHTASFPG